MHPKNLLCLSRLNKMDNSVDEIIALPEVMFNPSRMRVREFYDRYLNMLLVQPAQDVDNSITDGVCFRTTWCIFSRLNFDNLMKFNLIALCLQQF